jgi:uroporphyrinogen-III decarboxylase
MHADEYDEFTAAPYKTIIEKFLPRVCSALDTDPVNQGLTLATAFGDFRSQEKSLAETCAKLTQKFGYCPGMITGQRILAPFDFLADQLRGFKSITMDIRRIPDKIKTALDAITPLMIKMADPAVSRPGLISLIPLHLAPFINNKQFDELYWPSLEKTVVELDTLGVGCMIQVEQDCTRYAEYFARLPESTIFMIESGDPQRFTETLGQKHVFGGFYDPTITLIRSKEQCIDEAKRLLDICMESDHAYFIFDRIVMDIKSVDVSKLQAVLEWVRDKAVY